MATLHKAPEAVVQCSADLPLTIYALLKPATWLVEIAFYSGQCIGFAQHAILMSHR